MVFFHFVNESYLWEMAGRKGSSQESNSRIVFFSNAMVSCRDERIRNLRAYIRRKEAALTLTSLIKRSLTNDKTVLDAVHVTRTLTEPTLNRSASSPPLKWRSRKENLSQTQIIPAPAHTAQGRSLNTYSPSPFSGTYSTNGYSH